MFFAPPTVWIGLLRHPDFDKYDLSSLEKMLLRGIHHARGGLKGDDGATARKPRSTIITGRPSWPPTTRFLKAKDAMTKLGSAGMGGLNMETRLEE